MDRAIKQDRISQIDRLWRERAPRAMRAKVDAGQAGRTGGHQHAKFAESGSRPAKHPSHHNDPNSTGFGMFVETIDGCGVRVGNRENALTTLIQPARPTPQNATPPSQSRRCRIISNESHFCDIRGFIHCFQRFYPLAVSKPKIVATIHLPECSPPANLKRHGETLVKWMDILALGFSTGLILKL